MILSFGTEFSARIPLFPHDGLKGTAILLEMLNHAVIYLKENDYWGQDDVREKTDATNVAESLHIEKKSLKF